jgi:hypothetical protein
LINPNTTAFIRTTNEEVFVLEVANDTVKVRRPVQTTEGIKHIVDEFTQAELETLETRVLRNYAEQKLLKEQIEAMESSEGKDTPNAPLPITQLN